MRDSYFLHGHRHSPDGFDPALAGVRHYVGESGEPAFQNSWDNEGGDAEVLQFFLIVGPNRAGVTLPDKFASLEILGSVTGGTYGTVVFTLPDGYRPAKTQYLPGTDSNNNPLTWKVEATGDVSVLAGSVPDGSITGDKLENSGVTAGTYGDATHVAQVTVDAKGRVTAAADVAITAPAVTEAEISLSDVTTDNVSITEHGFAPKAPNDATKYLDGTGAWSIPAGSGGGGSGSSVGALLASPFSQQPTSPGADDADFTTGTSLPTGWSIAVSSGTLTNARLSHPLDTNPSNPTYNVNEDVPGALVQQMISGGLTKLYRAFAPASASRWMVITKVTLLNTISTDDRLHFGVTKSGETITSADEPDNSIWLELRCNTATGASIAKNQTVAWYKKNGGTLNGRQGETSARAVSGPVWFAIRGSTDNAIHLLIGDEGGWKEAASISVDNINGNVGYVWLATNDHTGDTPTVISIIHFVRTSLTDSNPFLLAAGG